MWVEADLVSLERVHDLLDAYLWLGNKFEHYFVEVELCFILRTRVAEIISQIITQRQEEKDSKLFEEEKIDFDFSDDSAANKEF